MNGRSSVEVVFFAALEKATPAERTAYLDETCLGNDGLRRRVEALLAAHTQVGQFLERPVVEAAGVAALDGMEHAAADLSFLAPSSEAGSLGRLDHYEVLEVVGRGGMGVVLRARDTKLLRVVALKVLAAPLAASGTARQRFVREARATAAVRNDHIVAIHAVCEDGPVPYLVMEFIDGCSLEARIRRGGPLEAKEVLRIGIQIASGLAAAHKQGLIHRDIKPANILLENGVQRVKLTDFGLARAADDASLTQSGLIAGTPLYMAPEQAAGEAIDARSDLFSLGSVLYELCTGRPAFRAANTVAVIRRVCDDTPRPIREVNPDIPEALCQVIEHLHAKKPADRPASAQDVAELLAELLAGLQQPVAVEHVSNVPDAEAWERAVAALPAEQQVKAVVRRLKELNPAFDGTVTPTIENGVVKGLSFLTDDVTDISPVRALKFLESLDCSGTVEYQGKLADLSPLRGLRLRTLVCGDNLIAELSPLQGMPLEKLHIYRNPLLQNLTPLTGMPLTDLAIAHTRVADLSPLKQMKLRFLYSEQTQVSDLSPLKGMPLEKLSVAYTCVSDLSPLQGMPLHDLWMMNTPVADLSPLKEMSLRHVRLDFQRERDAEILRSLKSLQTINDKPLDDFWKEVDGK
jgi:serine/threonine protein kinase